MRVIGLDPGLRRTGWGVIDADGARLTHVANGVVQSDGELATADRLVQLHEGINAVIADYRPDQAAVEETLVNKNAQSTLKLGVARGVAWTVRFDGRRAPLLRGRIGQGWGRTRYG